MIINISIEEAIEIANIDSLPVNPQFNLHWTDYQDTFLILSLLQKSQDILEIGTHYGYTAANLARNLEVNITTVDLTKELVSKIGLDCQEHELLSEQESGRECEDFPEILKIFNSSDIFFYNLDPSDSFDGCLIDGSHEEEQVLKDSVNALKYVRGPIIWHDVYNKYCNIDSPKIKAEPDNPGVVNALNRLPFDVYKIEDSWIAFYLNAN